MHFKRLKLGIMLMLTAICLVSCMQGGKNFKEAHDDFKTELSVKNSDNDDIPEPPEGLFDLVSYTSTIGDMSAYVSCDPADDTKHPLIIWICGGFYNGIDESPWSYPEWDNDQTGSAFWRAGILEMYPSLRGACGNPGNYETLFGEVDDIAAACKYAASLPYVDPDRIYLAGHSTGGTAALLAAEYTDDFRAVFCFGAVDNMRNYDNSDFTYDVKNFKENKMRSPIYWLDSIKKPVFLIEGIDGNSVCINRFKRKSKNDNINCYIVDGADHFSVLAPVTYFLTGKILNDTDEKCNITITKSELQAAMLHEPLDQYIY